MWLAVLLVAGAAADGQRELGSADISAAIARLKEARRAAAAAAAAQAEAQAVPATRRPGAEQAAAENAGLLVVPDDALKAAEAKGAAPPGFGPCDRASDCPGSRMLCLHGTCRCPVLFPGGQNCDEAREPIEPWCLTPLKTWPKDGPKYKGKDFTTCAVVGSADITKKLKMGKHIDAHTAIFRFNEAPSKGHTPYAGTGTTLRFQNRDRSGYAEDKGETCVVRSGKWYRGQNSGGKCKMDQMPKGVELYVDGHWKVHKGGPTNPGRPWFSNGFTGVVFALHMCARIDVYGLTQGSGYYFKKFAGRAKGWGRPNGVLGPPTKRMEMRHSWAKEKECLRRLADELPAQLFVHNG